MVIPDWNERPKAPHFEFKADDNGLDREKIARPLDRLAAAIVDLFVILVPIYVLLSAPFNRWRTTSFVIGAESTYIAMFVSMVALGMVLIVAYQTFFIVIFGATPGKILFDLKVKAMFKDEPLTAWHCALRALLWVVELAILGVPFLAVFSNGKRRPLHDRFADTIVVGRVHVPGLGAPAPWERGLVRGFFTACATIVTMFLISQGWDILKAAKTDSKPVAVKGCDAVDQVMDGDSGSTSHSRLKTAMTLYAAGLVEKNCLSAEVDREDALHVAPAPINYLAKAFVNDDRASLSDAYLDQVCAGGRKSVECAMSRIVTAWSEQDWQDVQKTLASAPRGSGYLEIWGVRHYMKQGEYREALKFLNSLSSHKEVAEFTMIQRVKALWDLNAREASSAAFAQAVLALPTDESHDLAAWLCTQELESGCQSQATLACQSTGRQNLKKLDFDHPGLVLSALMKKECDGDRGINYLSLSESAPDRNWKRFFRANFQQRRNELNSAAQMYDKVIASEDAPDLLKVEAMRRTLQFAGPTQLKRVARLWSEMDSKEAWIKSGNLLAAKLAKTDSRTALHVAELLRGEPQHHAEASREPASLTKRTPR